MRCWTMTLLGLSAAASAQGPDSRDPFCNDLRRVVAAAAEDPAFASLPDAAGATMLGFPHGCGLGGDARGRAYGCYLRLPPPELRVDLLAKQIERCLPAAERLPDAGREGMFREHVVRFSTPGATIEAAEGGWRTAGGGSVTLMVRPAG